MAEGPEIPGLESSGSCVAPGAPRLCPTIYVVRALTGGDELAHGVIEHRQRVIHVLIVETVEERELLLAVRGVVRAVDVEHHHLGGGGEVKESR